MFRVLWRQGVILFTVVFHDHVRRRPSIQKSQSTIMKDRSKPQTEDAGGAGASDPLVLKPYRGELRAAVDGNV